MTAILNELSLESVRDFMIMNGGRVTNHDLVTHFKYVLTNPQNRGKSIIIVLRICLVDMLVSGSQPFC